MNKLSLLIILLTCSLMGHSSKDQSLTQLQQRAVRFLAAELDGKITGRVEVSAGLIDPRLKLPHCPASDLEAYLPDYVQQPSQTSVVGVKCNSGSRWSVYVPVDINIYTNIVVLKHAVSHKQTIRPNDVSIIEYDTTNIHSGFFMDPNQVIGKAAKRNLAANRPILHSDIVVPDVIRRGDNVLITAQSGKLSIQANGIALNNGSMGEVINVKNPSSNKVLQAKIIGQKRVKIEI